MKKITFEEIDKLIELSQKPLADNYLESLQSWFQTDEPYYRFLYYLALTIKPKVCLEIGIQDGVGSAHMCAATSVYGGQVIGVDIKKPPFDLTSPYGNYNFIKLDSANAGNWARAITDAWGKLGLVFQDSSHHYLSSCKEWDIYSPLMSKDGIWVCDDITENFYNSEIDPPGKGMIQYFEERPGIKELFPDVLHKGSTIGVILS